jgi:hypothetical protein
VLIHADATTLSLEVKDAMSGAVLDQAIVAQH